MCARAFVFVIHNVRDSRRVPAGSLRGPTKQDPVASGLKTGSAGRRSRRGHTQETRCADSGATGARADEVCWSNVKARSRDWRKAEDIHHVLVY